MGNAFGQVAENEHPFVLHIEVGVAAVGLNFFAISAGGFVGSFDAVTGEDDACGFHLAVLRKGERFPVHIDLRLDAVELEFVAFAKGNTGGEIEVVEVGVVIAEWCEADLLEDIRDILRGEFFAFGAGEATAEGIAGKVGDLLLHVFRANLSGGGGEVGFGSLGDNGVRIGLETERGECVIVIPVGDVNLRSAPCPATAGPGEFFAIWGKDGQSIEAIRVGHADRVVLACGIDDVELKIGETVEVGGEDQVLATGVEIGCPAHRAELGDRFLVTAVGVHGPYLGDIALWCEAAPADAFAIGAEEGAAIVAGGVGEALHVRAVGIGGVNFHEVLFVDLQAFLVLFTELRFVSLAVAGEDDLFAVRRVVALGIVAARVGEIFERLVHQRVFPDVVVLVVVPGVAAHLGVFALLVLSGLQLFRVRIGVGRGEHDAFAVRVNPGAGRLAHAGRNALLIPGFEVHQVDLIKRVPFLALGLENHLLAIGGEVAFPRTFALEGELADVCDEVRLGLGKDRGGEEKEGEQAHGWVEEHTFAGNVCRKFAHAMHHVT